MPLRPTLIADVVMPTGGRLSVAKAFLTSTALTAVSGSLLLVFGLSAAGIFAVFLTAAALAAPLTDILNDNRRAIYDRAENSWLANGRTILGFLAIFFGMVVAFAGLAIYLGELRIDRGFGIFVSNVADHQTLFTQRFGPWPAFLARNLRVLGAAFLLALMFRSLGALLVLGWNAATWSSVLVLLGARAMNESGLPRGTFIAGAALALLPHILLEAAAYIVASLGAIFLSHGLVRYGPGHPRLLRVLRAGIVLILLSLAVLVGAAWIEDYWGGTMIRRLSSGASG